MEIKLNIGTVIVLAFVFGGIVLGAIGLTSRRR